MADQLTEEERGFVTSLLEWDAGARQRESLLLLLALAAGGVVIVWTLFTTVSHLTDRLVVFLTVPGLALGVALVLVYLFGKKRLDEKHRLASILRKLAT